MIVKNEQKHLPACLYNIFDIADEIIILDSGSTDNTEQIAKHFNAQWHVNTNWQGFGKQRQIAQSYATRDYILMLDPDEFPNIQLKNEILTLTREDLDNNTVFAIKYINQFCGRPVHGNAWYFDKIIRFYPRIPFSYHDYEVRESLNYHEAEVRTLKGYINHFTNDNLYHLLFKKNK